MRLHRMCTKKRNWEAAAKSYGVAYNKRGERKNDFIFEILLIAINDSEEDWNLRGRKLAVISKIMRSRATHRHTPTPTDMHLHSQIRSIRAGMISPEWLAYYRHDVAIVSADMHTYAYINNYHVVVNAWRSHREIMPQNFSKEPWECSMRGFS